MTLDVWLVARLAAELADAAVGARIQTVSGTPSGLRLVCRRRGATLTLRATLDHDGPLLSLGAASAENENVAGGWAGGVAPLLRGCSVESVQTVPDDRIIFVDVVSRSAFGVPARHRFAFELEPTKPNALVVRKTGDAGWQILAAAREFEGQRGGRDVLVGEPYVLPPPRRARLDARAFRAAVAAAEPEVRALVRLLGEHDPSCSPPLAREVVERALARNDRAGLAQAMLGMWAALRDDVERGVRDLAQPVFGWRHGDGYGTCHVVPLTWPPGAPETAATLNELCWRQQSAAERRRHAPATAALRKRLATMLDRCATEVASLEGARRRADEADDLRAAGESIYTYLAQIPPRADEFVTSDGLRVVLDPSLTAKENAASYFKRFKKARSGVPRIDARLAVLAANRAYWEELLWELDRAQAGPVEELSAICEELAHAVGARRGAAPKKPARPVRGRTVELPGGAIAHVGRSPKDNERVTFNVGGPNDLWFHARGTPGAHVILKLADRRAQPTDEQILAAAALAAGHSRAADAAKVDVDYTQRKHVRKQGGGRTGLVWYIDFKTVRVQPRKL